MQPLRVNPKFSTGSSPNLPFDVLQKRLLVDRRRISEAYFLFPYLEAASRYGIPNYQVIYNNNLEETILKHKEEFDTAFRKSGQLVTLVIYQDAELF